MKFAINFDLTISKTDSPLTAASAYPKAVETIAALQAAGHDFILMTTRTGADLTAATNWLTARGITPDEVNLGVGQSITAVIVPGVPPDPDTVDVTPYKIVADVYIDNKGIGIPLTNDVTVSGGDNEYGSKRVDWDKIQEWLINNGVFTEGQLN